MQYFLAPLLMLIYFEVLGRWIFLKFNKDPWEFSFTMGFVAVIGFMFFFFWPVTSLNQSFYLLLALCVLSVLISVLCILKDFKKINFKINYKWWIIFILLVIFQTYISSQRSLGETHGFDTLYYLNMIDFNIGNPALNTLHPHFGTYPNTDIQWFTYIFQSFYYFFPVVIYLFRTLLGFIGMSFETLPAFIWGGQILLNTFFSATALICIQKLNQKNKLFNLACIILLVLFMNNFYFNNTFGFIGNNFRMSIHALSTIVLLDYLKSYQRSDLYLFLLMQLGLCGFASTGTFALVFILFGLFFVLYDKEKDLLKIYAIVMYVPLLTVLVAKLKVQLWIYPVVFIFCLIIYLMNDFILKLYQHKMVRIITIIAVFCMLWAGSYLMEGQLIDLHYFFHNYSEIADMSWDYFMFNDVRHYIFNLMILVPLFYYLWKYRHQSMAKVMIILMLTFFNPLASRMMNTINWVYYRAYDLFINQYTIILFMMIFIEHFKSKKVQKGLIITFFTASCILASIQIPHYFHESFKVDEHMDPLYKIDKEELEVIYNVRNMVNDLGIKSPKIITSTFFMPTFIEDSTYLFGKEKRYNTEAYDDASYALYLILFPVDYIYDFFRPDTPPDYENTIQYLNECDYDILVVDNGLYYDDVKTGEHLPITNLIEADGSYQKSVYSTAKYAVYDLSR